MDAAVNISIPESLLAEIENAAKAEHRSVDEVLTDAVEGTSKSVHGRNCWTTARSGRSTRHQRV